jgi:dihydrofolate synthase/folylpolyglutamate synthase
MKSFTYSQAAGFLDDSLIFGIKPNLLRINGILKLMGNPHKSSTDFIHIVGTNGKTSTAIMTAAILNSHGLRAAYHISPHINHYTERLWFCGNPVTKQKFGELFSEVYPYIEEVNRLDLGGPITQFEIIAAMAFYLCARESIDVMVLEAGLGGRWDATNAADSKVAGLTGVSLEHTAVLGGTIEKIAREKSMVIKKGAPVATTSTDKIVLDVLKKRAALTNSRLYLYDRDFYIESKQKIYMEGWDLTVRTLEERISGVRLPLIGNYQPMNFLLAAVLSELYLGMRGKKLLQGNLIKAMADIKVTGRFEILRKRPLVIADTSHNPEGLENFFKNLDENFEGFSPDKENDRGRGSKIIVFSVLKDKDYKKMLETAASGADVLILASSNTPRSLSPDSLEKEYMLYCGRKNKKTDTLATAENKSEISPARLPDRVYKMDTVVNSLNFALKIAGENDIICITGSITNLENIV